MAAEPNKESEVDVSVALSPQSHLPANWADRKAD